MVKIAAVVIAYFPDDDLLRANIDTYYNYTDQLFIVFNSPADPDCVQKLNESYPDSVIIFNNQNEGIASVLNLIAGKALNRRYNWLLTMDQDSRFQSGDFFRAFSESKLTNVAVFCPNGEVNARPISGMESNGEEILTAFTSGSLVNLQIWNKIGGFEEKLFIDEVDHDYCLKAITNGFKIILFRNIPLIHKLGTNKRIKLFRKEFEVVIHPPLRSYYIIRNNLYIFSKYGKDFPGYVRSRKMRLWKDFIKMVLFSGSRINRLAYASKGIHDYYCNHYGSHQDSRVIREKSTNNGCPAIVKETIPANR